MNVLEIPQVLFEEFSKKIGIGEEWEQKINRYDGLRDGMFGLKRIIKAFDKTEQKNRVDGYNRTIAPMIGYRDESDKSGPYHIFALWGLVPLQTNEIFDVPARLLIIAQAENAGLWSATKGHLMRQTCKATFSYYGMDLFAPSSTIIPLILGRAIDLTEEAELREYWEKEPKHRTIPLKKRQT